MPGNENNNAGRFVALYWDFENLHASLCEEKDPGSYARPDNRFKPQEPLARRGAEQRRSNSGHRPHQQQQCRHPKQDAKRDASGPAGGPKWFHKASAIRA